MDNDGLVPTGAFTYPILAPRKTRKFTFLILPEFTLLAFSSALDPLRIANQLAQQPLYSWTVASADGTPEVSSSGVAIAADTDVTDLSPDSHLLICSGNRGTEVASDKVLSAVRKHARFGGRIGGICTGAASLARAGFLRDRRFTLHWENQPGFAEVFPDLTPTRSRYEIDGDLMTCGGGSAATDMIVAMITEDYGRDFAVAVSDMCLNPPDLDRQRDQRSSIGKAIGSRNPKVLAVLRDMYANVEQPLDMTELAARARVSRRQLERQFKLLLGETPSTTYRNIRLDRARALLVETDLPLIDVAMATGFNSQNVFSRHFRSRFGMSPSGQRGITRRPREE